MITLQIHNEPKAETVDFTSTEMIVTLDDGRKLSIPLIWYRSLMNATKHELSNYELIGDGEGIHWPLLDEDLSVKGFLMGVMDAAPKKNA